MSDDAMREAPEWAAFRQWCLGEGAPWLSQENVGDLWATWQAATAESAKEVERLRAALNNLLIAAGEGGRHGRAIDLLPRKYVEEARAAIDTARAGERHE